MMKQLEKDLALIERHVVFAGSREQSYFPIENRDGWIFFAGKGARCGEGSTLAEAIHNAANNIAEHMHGNVSDLTTIIGDWTKA